MCSLPEEPIRQVLSQAAPTSKGAFYSVLNVRICVYTCDRV